MTNSLLAVRKKRYLSARGFAPLIDETPWTVGYAPPGWTRLRDHLTNLGYTHDTAEAMARVAAGEAQAAFFMNATKVEEVLAACEAGFVLPQKSTYFQPKLATGLVMYGLDGPAPK